MTGAAVFLKVLIAAAIIVAGSVLAIWGLIKGTQGLIWLLSHLAKGIAFFVGHVFRFVRNTFSDTFRAIGALLTAMVLVPLTLLNLLFFRWSAGKHYAKALEDEIVSFALGLYRVALGNPLHFVGMGMITDGFERRLPEVVARAPRKAGHNVKDGKFDGYKVTGVLPAGGSGARLFLAKPRAAKLQELLNAGHEDPGQVVIKAFSLSTGSTLPQIVRESRALQSARNLGLVLEHELSEKNFHYVMPYVPGDNLDVVIHKMHDKSGDKGLDDRQLRVGLGYVGDLLYTLDAFHNGGLWHKDIKPSNLIVSEGRAHLVDLGLVTPLSSAMTLTTHGTEYFRDPEMVRQAMRGVKVHEVNGVKFDIYSAGAVLYTLIENSFPAHGSLSRVSKRCPEVMNWIIRRSMADLEGRYGSAQEMLADIRTVLSAKDPFAVRPADLPSVNGRRDWQIPRTDFANKTRSTRAASFASNDSKASSDSRSSKASGRPRPMRKVAHTATAVKDYRRSTGRSMVAAFIGFLFLAGMAGVAIFGARSASYHAPVSFAEDPVEWCLENESSESAEGAVAGHQHDQPSASAAAIKKAKRQVAEGLQVAKHAGDRFESFRRQWAKKLDNKLDHLADEGRRMAKAAGESIEHSGTVLLLQDLAPTTDRSSIEALQGELERRSFEVLGNPLDGIGDERDILYLAGARKAVGVSTLDDEDALERLELYLGDNPNIDALIWISEGNSKGTIKFQFVRPATMAGESAGTFALTSQN